MNFKIDNGQLTISFQNAMVGRDRDGFRLQLYWPKISIKNYKKGKNNWQRGHKELYISFPTLIRLVWEEGYWGFGGELLGFGGALDWQKQEN